MPETEMNTNPNFAFIIGHRHKLVIFVPLVSAYKVQSVGSKIGFQRMACFYLHFPDGTILIRLSQIRFRHAYLQKRTKTLPVSNNK